MLFLFVENRLPKCELNHMSDFESFVNSETLVLPYLSFFPWVALFPNGFEDIALSVTQAVLNLSLPYCFFHPLFTSNGQVALPLRMWSYGTDSRLSAFKSKGLSAKVLICWWISQAALTATVYNQACIILLPFPSFFRFLFFLITIYCCM